jgi:hypothetical protein
MITDVVASAAGYAFVETSVFSYGEGGWRVWFLATGRSEPSELDRGRAPGAGSPPTIAMEGSRIAWAGFDEPASGPVSRLRTVRTDDLSPVATVIDQTISDGMIWYPALNGEELWYSLIHADVDGGGSGDEFHIEFVDLANPDGQPTRFPGVGNDFNAVATPDLVVWKTAVGDSAALNWGTLHVLNRGTEDVWEIPVPNANRPSIGDRYIAFDEITHSRLLVFDPISQNVIDLTPSEVRGKLSVGGESLSGRLLTFFVQDEGAPQISWAYLPT